jgi:hypothetical protein
MNDDENNENSKKLRASRPSERFCKHGFLTEGERYNQDLHNTGQTIEDRCSEYYTPEEIARMKDEITVAECGICLTNLTDINNCIVCSHGHIFHKTCLTDYWTIDPSKQNWCPITNSIPNRWQECRNINDINSGGRRRNTKRKRKTKRRNTKRRNTKKRKKVWQYII